MDSDSDTKFKYERRVFLNDVREENLVLKVRIRELEYKLHQIHDFINGIYKASCPQNAMVAGRYPTR
jgi:hypothetical protein